jgi:serine/threonine protein phosphatase 1
MNQLSVLFSKIEKRYNTGDIIIFLGDYIDRGPSAYDVIDYLIDLSEKKKHQVVFLKGNHEDMLLRYISGNDKHGVYHNNGGIETIKSYTSHLGSFYIPEKHLEFFMSLRYYYEAEDFIAVHAGIKHGVENLQDQKPNDMLWIRDTFYRTKNRFTKTVIFGHTPAMSITGGDPVLFDDERNIIGIDGGVIFGMSLLCLCWPGREIIKGE